LLPTFVTEDYHPPLTPLPVKDEVQQLHERVDNLLDKVCFAEPTTPSADALDLGDEAFPALGVSKTEKGVEVKKEVVSSGGS
jgi:hypothetical protein